MRVQFGKSPNQVSHAFRHVQEAGLNNEAVKYAISKDLSNAVHLRTEGRFIARSVYVDGKLVNYKAFKLPGGTINVGRITVS